MFNGWWPNLTYLYASSNNLDDNGKTDDPMTGYDNVFDPNEQYGAYRLYLQPREEFVIETDTNVHSRSMFKDAEEDRSTEYNGGDSFRRGSTCRVLLCICLIITLITVVISAVVLAVLLTSETRKNPITQLPSSYESSIRLRNKTFVRELEIKNSTEFVKLEGDFCHAMEMMMKDGFPIKNLYEDCEVVEFTNGSVVAHFKLNLKGTPSLTLGELLRDFIKKKIEEPGPWQIMGWDEQSIKEFVHVKRPERTFVSKTKTATTSSEEMTSSVQDQFEMLTVSSITDTPLTTSVDSSRLIQPTGSVSFIESTSLTLISATGLSSVVQSVLPYVTEMLSVHGESVLLAVQSESGIYGTSELESPSLLSASDVFSIGESESSMISHSGLISVGEILSSSVINTPEIVSILESASIPENDSIIDTASLSAIASNIFSILEATPVSTLPESVSQTSLHISPLERTETSLMLSELDSLIISSNLESYAASSEFGQSATTSALITDSLIESRVFSSFITLTVPNDGISTSDTSVIVSLQTTTPIIEISPVSILSQSEEIFASSSPVSFSYPSLTRSGILKSITSTLIELSAGSDVVTSTNDPSLFMSSAVGGIVTESDDYVKTSVLQSQVEGESEMVSVIKESPSYLTISESFDILSASSFKVTQSSVFEFNTTSAIATLKSQSVTETQIPYYHQTTSLSVFPTSVLTTIALPVSPANIDETSLLDVTSSLLISSKILPDSKSIEVSQSTRNTSVFYDDSSVAEPEIRDITAILDISSTITTSYILKAIPSEEFPLASGIDSRKVHMPSLKESSFVSTMDLHTSFYVISDVSLLEHVSPRSVKHAVSSEHAISSEMILATPSLTTMGDSTHSTSSQIKDRSDETRLLFTFDLDHLSATDESISSVFAVDASVTTAIMQSFPPGVSDSINVSSKPLITSVFQSDIVTSNTQQSQQLSPSEQVESSYVLSVSSETISSIVYSSLSIEKRLSSSIFSESISGGVDSFSRRLSTEQVLFISESIAMSPSFAESELPMSPTTETESAFSINPTSQMFTSSYIGKSVDAIIVSIGDTFSSVTKTYLEPTFVSSPLETTNMMTPTPVRPYTTTEVERFTAVVSVSHVTDYVLDSTKLFTTTESVSASLFANTSEPILEVNNTVSVTSSAFVIQPTSIRSVVSPSEDIFTSGSIVFVTAVSDDTDQMYNVTTDSGQDDATTDTIFEKVNISASSVYDAIYDKPKTLVIKDSFLTSSVNLPSVASTTHATSSMSVLLSATPQMVDTVSSLDISVTKTSVVSKPTFKLPQGLNPSEGVATIDRMLFNIDELFN